MIEANYLWFYDIWSFISIYECISQGFACSHSKIGHKVFITGLRITQMYEAHKTIAAWLGCHLGILAAL